MRVRPSFAGVYETNAEKMGRYGMEVTSACGTVIDTGIHAFNWSREDGLAYMRQFSFLTEEEVTFDRL